MKTIFSFTQPTNRDLENDLFIEPSRTIGIHENDLFFDPANQ
jgi:hypothetical protein